MQNVIFAVLFDVVRASV